jgi:hypothetical protein
MCNGECSSTCGPSTIGTTRPIGSSLSNVGAVAAICQPRASGAFIEPRYTVALAVLANANGPSRRVGRLQPTKQLGCAEDWITQSLSHNDKSVPSVQKCTRPRGTLVDSTTYQLRECGGCRFRGMSGTGTARTCPAGRATVTARPASDRNGCSAYTH